MGIDFLVCDHCRDTFPDCGPYERCNEDCWRKWCPAKYSSCAADDGYMVNDEEDEYGEPIKSCSYCRNESATDAQLFEYLLDRYELDRDEVEEEFLLAMKEQSSE